MTAQDRLTGLYYEKLARHNALVLLQRIETLRTIISTNSPWNFYIHLSWRKVNDRVMFHLLLALYGLYYDPNLLYRDEETALLYREYVRPLLEKSVRRFQEHRKFGLLVKIFFGPHGKWLSQFRIGTELLPYREYKGNYNMNLEVWLEENLTIRRETPRRVKKETFIRGYRDHGTMVSESEKAVRSANTDRDLMAKSLLSQSEHLKDNPEHRWKWIKRLIQHKLD